MPGLAEQTQTRLGEISFLFTARSFGYLRGSLLSGRLYDWFRGHLLLALGLIGMAAMLAAVPLMPLVTLLAAILFLVGAAEGFVDVGTNTLIVLINSIFWGALTLGRLASIPISIRFSACTLLAVDLAGGIPSAAIMVLLPDSMPALWAGAFDLGLSMASIFPTMLSLAGARMTMTGNINSIFFAASSVGAAGIIAAYSQTQNKRCAKLRHTQSLTSSIHGRSP